MGNIGQLAVDVLVNSLGSAKLMCKIGYLDHDSVLPVIGNDALDIADPGAAFFSLEVFYSRELQILAVQQRAPFLPGKRHRRKFIQDLSSWTKSVGIRKIILPCSFPGHRKSDSHLLAQLKRDTGLQLNVFLGGRSIPAVEELCERMNWNIMDSLEPKMSQGEEALIGPLNKGLGIQGIKETAGTFLEEPENQIIVLGVFANEGDNSFEGISVGTGLVQLILSMLNGSESAEFIKKISIIPPLSWHHAFGGAHNPRVYY